MLPGLMSHYSDGSRHDYREAARVLTTEASEDTPLLSDDAETISYYLSEDMQRNLLVRTKVVTFPDSEFLLVTRANSWIPQPRIAGRQVMLLAEISRRRYDYFSHILRVYRVARSERATTRS